MVYWGGVALLGGMFILYRRTQLENFTCYRLLSHVSCVIVRIPPPSGLFLSRIAVGIALAAISPLHFERKFNRGGRRKK